MSSAHDVVLIALVIGLLYAQVFNVVVEVAFHTKHVVKHCLSWNPLQGRLPVRSDGEEQYDADSDATDADECDNIELHGLEDRLPHTSITSGFPVATA